MQVVLVLVRPVSGEMEYPVGPNGRKHSADGRIVAKVNTVQRHMRQDRAYPPVFESGPHQEVCFVAVGQHCANEVRAHETRTAGDDDPFHRLCRLKK